MNSPRNVANFCLLSSGLASLPLARLQQGPRPLRLLRPVQEHRVGPLYDRPEVRVRQTPPRGRSNSRQSLADGHGQHPDWNAQVFLKVAGEEVRDRAESARRRRIASQPVAATPFLGNIRGAIP